MYKYKIVVDSSSNLKNDYIKDENIAFEVVPLTIHIQGKEYVDDEKSPYVYINIIKNYKDKNGFEYIHYEDIDEGKFEYVRIMTIKEYIGCDFEFAKLTCNTENL